MVLVVLFFVLSFLMSMWFLLKTMEQTYIINMIVINSRGILFGHIMLKMRNNLITNLAKTVINIKAE